MGNTKPMTRRVFITLTGTALATTSGCLGFLGIRTESDSGGDSDSSSNSDSDAGDSSTNGSNTADNLSEPEANSSETAPSAEDETNEARSEENEASVPESNPQNDPSETEPADPNTTEPPTDDDIEHVESSFSKSANEATITVRNTANERVNSIDLWVVFYDDSGQQVDEGMNGATSVDPDQTVRITVPCEAADATAFEIQRVMVSN
ncbi:FxLYD domain-containing protein [Halalkalicoccus sp. GCM10025322]|uniref:FxLYD domain-containing protein n=1 Tax=Halalkalicoccus TaxID=332246 RepID=UPI002F96B260